MTRTIVCAYLDLTKPRILSLVLITTTFGFYLGARGIHSLSLLMFTLLGTAFVCAGASALNHYLERDADSLMKRTQNRPLPKGIILSYHAMVYGIGLILFGILLLYWKVNLLTAFLSLLTAFLYVLIYTPMKKITWFNTTIGAIPGAMPPLGGWAAARGELDIGAWVLFLIMFFWQHPHFYAIAWMFKEDYKLGGFKMLPVIDEGGKRTFSQIIMYSLFLIPTATLPTIIGLSGYFYFLCAILLSVAFLAAGMALAISPTVNQARRLLKASILYLPFLFLLAIFDVTF